MQKSNAIATKPKPTRGAKASKAPNRLSDSERAERIAAMKAKLAKHREARMKFGYRTYELYQDGSAIVTEYGPGPDNELVGTWFSKPDEDACIVRFPVPEVKQLQHLANAAGLSLEAYLQRVFQEKLKSIG